MPPHAGRAVDRTGPITAMWLTKTLGPRVGPRAPRSLVPQKVRLAACSESGCGTPPFEPADRTYVRTDRGNMTKHEWRQKTFHV